MKIIGVIGSPNRKGGTAVLTREVLKGAASAGAETEEIFLAEYRIEYCRGCIGRNTARHCMSTGRCSIDDDADMLRDRLYAADGIVLSSPTYGLQMTARMKNFLVDRIGMYSTYTSAFGGTYFAGVSTCGGIGARALARDLGSRFVTGFHQRAYMSGYIGEKIGYDRIEDHPKAVVRAYALGCRLASDIKKQKRYPLQKIGNRALTAFVVRPMILKNIREQSNGTMKAVYENLLGRGLISP